MGTLVQFMLPRWTMMLVARIAGHLAYLLNQRKRVRLETNCRHVLGPAATPAQIRQTVLRTFVHLVMNYFDLLRIPVLRRRITQLVEYDLHVLNQLMDQGRGCIIVTGHLGNWDLAGAFLAALGYPMSAVVEPVPRGWGRTFNRYRSATALETIPIPDHARIAEALQKKRVLALVADRDLTGSGIICPAFDARRSIPRGPAAYSLRYDVPIAIGYLVFQDRPGHRPYLGVVEEPLRFERTGNLDADVTALTGLIAQRLNQLIARYLDQWPVFAAGWK
ncbi:MAG: lysophospholipid acyltransferase family protein [candidate division WOR-3 bacterium]